MLSSSGLLRMSPCVLFRSTVLCKHTQEVFPGMTRIPTPTPHWQTKDFRDCWGKEGLCLFLFEIYPYLSGAINCTCRGSLSWIFLNLEPGHMGSRSILQSCQVHWATQHGVESESVQLATWVRWYFKGSSHDMGWWAKFVYYKQGSKEGRQPCSFPRETSFCSSFP
jgi:hypothetical protein